LPNQGTVTLAQLRADAQSHADMASSQFVSTAEWLNFINSSYFELYDILVQKYGNNYYVATPATISLDGTNDLFALPVDFYKLLGVDLQVAGAQANGWLTLRPFNFADRNRFVYPNVQVTFGLMSNLHYRLNGDKLWFTPRPAAGQTVRVWYIPRLVALVNDTDVVDGVSGWEHYIVIGAAIQALLKEESDTSALERERAELVRRIESAAENRDAGSPATVSDTQRTDSAWPDGGFNGPY
jgi:hypothetical protein